MFKQIYKWAFNHNDILDNDFCCPELHMFRIIHKP